MQTPEQKLYHKQIPGWLGDGDMEAISCLANRAPTGATIVEIGSMHGKSACCLASAKPESIVFCFDFWPGNDIKASDGIIRLNTIERFIEYTKIYPNIIPIKIDSNLDYKWTGPSVDLFFIDAAHTNPTDWQSIEYWLPKIKSGGVICGHDYYTIERNNIVHFPDINENIARLEKMLEKTVTVYEHSCVWSFTL